MNRNVSIKNARHRHREIIGGPRAPVCSLYGCQRAAADPAAQGKVHVDAKPFRCITEIAPENEISKTA